MTGQMNFPSALRGAAPPPLTAEADELDLLGIFRLIRRRIGLIVLTGLVVLVAAIPAIFAMTPSYYAQSRLLIQSPLATTLSVEVDGLTDLNLTTEVERLMSRQVSTRVVEELKLDERAEFNPDLREPSATAEFVSTIRNAVKGVIEWAVGSAPQTSDPEPPVEAPAPDSMDLIVPAYLGALSISREPTGNIIGIGFSSQDPLLAAAVPNTLLRVYLDDQATERATQIRTADDWFAARITEQTQRIAAAEEDLDTYRKASGPASPELRAANLDMIADLDQERSSILRERVENQASLDALDAAETRAARVALVETPEAIGLRRQQQLQQRDLDRLLAKLGENSPIVIDARAGLVETEAAIDVEVEQYREKLEADLAALGRREAGAGEAMRSARGALLEQEAVLSRRTALEQDVATEKAVLKRLEEQRRTLAAKSNLPLTDIEVLVPATVPVHPYTRGRGIYLIAALMAAAALGLTTAVLLELFDRSVRSFQTLQDIPGLMPAGMLPRLPRRLARSSIASSGQWLEGPFGDALRGTLLTLERSNDGALPKSILVVSSLPGEGKSVLAASLAAELALVGARDVLLLDADLRHGRVHGLFDSEAEPGLAEVLAGDIALSEVIRHDAATGLSYIPRGNQRRGFMQDKSRIGAILNGKELEGRTVIIDGPPALATTDAALLAELATRTIFTVQWGRTSRKTIEAAIDRLRVDPRQPLLVAINRVRPRRHALYGFKDAPWHTNPLRRYLGAI